MFSYLSLRPARTPRKIKIFITRELTNPKGRGHFFPGPYIAGISSDWETMRGLRKYSSAI
jgi:hypothetical protein